MISVRLQGKPFNITVIQVYAPTSNAEEAEVEQFYEDLCETKKSCLTHNLVMLELYYSFVFTKFPKYIFFTVPVFLSHIAVFWNIHECLSN